MIGQIIQSYLVSLGAQVDKPGFQQADQAIKQTGENVERITGGMARNFVKASTIIASAIASVTASAVGLMKAAAQEDLAMQKYARTMMMSEDAAWKMKKATDALGESINDIALTPELLGRFTQLTADGSKMQVGGDFKQTMKDFRDLMFEFTRLKQEASYALNWVGYYLMKYLQKPLADIKEKFKTFNDTVIKGMSVWTEKVARAIYYVIEVGRHLIEFLGDIGKAVYKLWDSFPSGVKKAIAAIGLLTAVLKASPFSRAIMLISTLLLLIDDYYGYMEGKNAAFGKYWDKLNEYLEKGKVLWEQLKTKAEPYWNMLVEYAGRAKAWFDELVEGAGELKKSFDEWMDSTGNELLADFVEECQSLWGILTDIGSTIKDTLLDAWKGLWEQLEKNGTLDDRRKNFERVWRVMKMLYQAGKDLINFFLRLWRELEKSEEVREFGAAIMELYDAVLELLGAISDVVETALRAFFGEFNKTDKVTSFRDVLRSVAKALTIMARGISSVIRWLTKLFQKVANNKTFISFWKHVADAIDTVIKKCGKLGRAFGALLDGDPKKAWKILQSLGDNEGKEAGAGNTDWNKRVVYERLKAAGYNDEAIAGIMGRVQQEHNFDTSDVPEHWETLENGEKVWVGGLGMFQWNGDNPGERKYEFKKWAQENGLNYLDPGVQTDYAIIEAKQRGLGPDEMNKMSVAEAANAWTKDWEVGRPGNEVHNATIIYGEITHGNGNTWMDAKPTASTADDSENAPGAGEDLERQYFRKWSSVEGMDTPWESNKATDTNDFRQTTVDMLNALGKAYYEQFGERLVITGGAEKGDYHETGKYSHANGYKVDISDDISQYQRMWLEQWLETNEKRYGIRYNHEADKAHYDIVAGHPMAMQTAYTTGKANVVPLGMANANSMIPAPYGDSEATQADLDGLNDPRLVKVGNPQRTGNIRPVATAPQTTDNTPIVYLKQIADILTSIQKTIQSVGGVIPQEITGTFGSAMGEIGNVAQELTKILPTDIIGKLADSLPDIHGCFDDLAELGQRGLPIFEQMQSGFNPADIINNIGGGKSVDIKIDMGGITVNGAGNPEATGRAVLKHVDQDLQFIAANRLSGNHGIVSI